MVDKALADVHKALENFFAAGQLRYIFEQA
jgi:hypothetical protein